MFDELKNIGTSILHVSVKVITGLIILPLGIFISERWEWWSEETHGSKKWITGIFFVPAAAFLWATASWWDDF